jgi:protein gp37
MGVKSTIEWTDATWNVAVGCTKVDADCLNCYMYRDSLNGTRYEPKQVRRTKTVFNLPLRIKQPSRIFTSSLTDVFHESIDPWRQEVWDIITKCPQHTFQILTKRPERIISQLPMDQDYLSITPNIWLGTSIGSQNSQRRVIDLLAVQTLGVLFVSCEPLYGPIDLIDITGKLGSIDLQIDALSGRCIKKYPGGSERLCPIHRLNWVIVGGESGNDRGQYRYRECKLEWIEKIVNDCKEAAVPVFIKQLGTHLAKKLGLKDRHGRDMDEWPEHLRIRQFPNANKV